MVTAEKQKVKLNYYLQEFYLFLIIVNTNLKLTIYCLEWGGGSNPQRFELDRIKGSRALASENQT